MWPEGYGDTGRIVAKEWGMLSVAQPCLAPPSQGFTYVAPSVLDSSKEGFSFQPKLRSPRRLNSSPRTPVRYHRAEGSV